MKSVGIVRKIDNLGRFVIPSELRKLFGLKNNDPLEIFTDGDIIMVRKYSPACIFCGEVGNTFRVGDKLICRRCADVVSLQKSEEV